MVPGVSASGFHDPGVTARRVAPQFVPERFHADPSRLSGMVNSIPWRRTWRHVHLKYEVACVYAAGHGDTLEQQRIAVGIQDNKRAFRAVVGVNAACR